MRSFGLIGKKLDHSFSKKYFEEKFEKQNIDAQYVNIELSRIEDFPVWLKDHEHWEGLNVTVPYKETVIPYLDALSDTAVEIGAVNTISFENDRLIGHNTDAYGFRQAIKPFLRNVHERALILGTGGAAKAVAYVLKSLGIEVSYLSRNQTGVNIFSYEDANAHMVNAFKMIVNTTPVGMFPAVGEKPTFPVGLCGEDHFVVDLIYNPEETVFLKEASEAGADTMNGLSMLKHQADKAWEIWNA
ncbi:MAG: shikimate dehydrogenase [Brumimicrobium sp.]|nr:shikimate dehydrogenase [Brumimicrobium sp.]